MPRQQCTVCLHPQRDEIDLALAKGAPLRGVAKQFDVTTAAVFRHRHHDDQKRPKNTGEIDRINDEIARLTRARNRAKRKRNDAEALAIARELRNWLTLKAKFEALAGARQVEQGEPLTPQEALQMARALIEAHASDPEITAWIAGLYERATGTVPEAQPQVDEKTEPAD